MTHKHVYDDVVGYGIHCVICGHQPNKLKSDSTSRNCKTMAFKPLKIKPFSDIRSKNMIYTSNEYNSKGKKICLNCEKELNSSELSKGYVICNKCVEK